MAGGGQQADAGSLALQQRVGRDRGAVHDARGLLQQRVSRQAESFGGEGDACENAVGLVGRRRGGLGDNGSAGGGHDDVSEGAANIDADRVGHESPESGGTAEFSAGASEGPENRTDE